MSGLNTNVHRAVTDLDTFARDLDASSTKTELVALLDALVIALGAHSFNELDGAIRAARREADEAA